MLNKIIGCSALCVKDAAILIAVNFIKAVSVTVISFTVVVAVICILSVVASFIVILIIAMFIFTLFLSWS